MQVKIITSKELENKINDFLEKNIKVIDIKYQITSTACPLFSVMIISMNKFKEGLTKYEI